MLEVIDWRTADAATRAEALLRAPQIDDPALMRSVETIIARVRADGDAAVRDLTARYDGCEAPVAPLPESRLAEAANGLSPALREAMQVAIRTIEAFHSAQKPGVVAVETQNGVRCELRWKPIDRVGLYVPGGRAPLLSSLMMLAIPARLAGCERRILCTPPGRDGSVHPAILAAAFLCGVREVFPIGGAQAIAAMAFGTAAVPKVDKIFGPGNAWVTAAKQKVAEMTGGAAIDMPAGPSEVMVLASRGANPAFIAADLLAQAEHGPDSQAILVTDDRAVAEAARRATLEQLETLDRRAIAHEALGHSRIIVTETMEEALAVANAYASEHLILMGAEAEARLDDVTHAGAVFVGSWTPETAGDYASGANHVLPTSGYARAYSGLNLVSFMKSMTVQRLSREGLAALAPTLTALADAEGLGAHAAAVTVRTGGVA